MDPVLLRQSHAKAFPSRTRRIPLKDIPDRRPESAAPRVAWLDRAKMNPSRDVGAGRQRGATLTEALHAAFVEGVYTLGIQWVANRRSLLAAALPAYMGECLVQRSDTRSALVRKKRH